MKPLLLTTLLSLLLTTAFSQCDKKATCKSLVGRFVDGTKNLPDMDLEATVTIDKEKIVLDISIGGRPMTAISTIKSVEKCEWKEFLKSGQAVYKVTTDKGNGVLENSIFKVVGKDGKTTIYFGSDPDDKGGLELDISESKIDN